MRGGTSEENTLSYAFGHSCEAETCAPSDTAPNQGSESEALRRRAEHAFTIVNAGDATYRAMMAGGPEWGDIRDHHGDTLDRLGPTQRGHSVGAIVWERNTHIGDARATMAERGMVNVGQLVRESLKGRVVLVGFGSHRV